MCQKKMEEKKGGEEMTEETSEKSEELESKDQGACKEGRLFAAKAKNKRSVGDYLCATAYVSIELLLLKSI